MKKRIGLLNIEHLKNRTSWTMGVAGVVRLLTWETKTTLGKSKTKFQKQIIKDVYNLSKNEDYTLNEIEGILNKQIKNEVVSANVSDIYESPKKDKLISPIEAQRRLRYFSEEFLNKEFDILLSLLPNSILTNYFATFFPISKECEWSVFGSSNDFEQSTEISFMYMDTLAYCHKTSTLVALELKMDSPIGDGQLLKYIFMSAYLESKGMIAQNTTLHILFLSPDSKTSKQIPLLLKDSKKQLENKQYPKKRVTLKEMESLAPRVHQILQSVIVQHTTWQKFGDNFEILLRKIPKNGYSESLYKLIDGFLITLQTKYSRKQKKQIYIKGKMS